MSKELIEKMQELDKNINVIGAQAKNAGKALDLIQKHFSIRILKDQMGEDYNKYESYLQAIVDKKI